jgi:hypothetical protein
MIQGRRVKEREGEKQIEGEETLVNDRARSSQVSRVHQMAVNALRTGRLE